MIDTRYIDEFVHPQKLVERINNHGGHFSAWDKDSSNFVMTQLLTEHATAIVNDDKSWKRLNDTVKRVGLSEGKKMLFLSPSSMFVMCEMMTRDTVNISIGKFKKDQIEILLVGCEIEFTGNPDQHGKLRNMAHANIWHPDQIARLDHEKIQMLIGRFAMLLLYLIMVEVEVVFVKPKEKFRAKKYEGFKNLQKIPIAVADLGWSRETINALPFGVSGHLRNARVGPGRTEQKLVYIEPYTKSGYHRKAGKDRILNHQ